MLQRVVRQFFLLKGSGKESLPGCVKLKFTMVLYVMVSYFIPSYSCPVNCVLPEKKPPAFIIQIMHIEYVIHYSLPGTKLI